MGICLDLPPSSQSVDLTSWGRGPPLSYYMLCLFTVLVFYQFMGICVDLILASYPGYKVGG